MASQQSGRRDYDALTAREQAVVRAEWAERIAGRLEELDLGREFTRAGRSYVELDDDGNVVERDVSSSDAD